MRHFWNELNGLAARCNFGNITESLVKDVFIVNINNKDVQQKLCTESKNTIADTIQFAKSYEERALRQQSFDKLDKPNIKPEPNEINNITTGKKRWVPTKKCFRCEAPFSPQNLKECKAKGITCMKCGKKRYFAKCCQTRDAGNFAKSRKVTKAPAQSIQRLDEWEDSSSGSIVEEDRIVLTIEGEENGQFSMSGKINGNPFKTMVDSGSPVTLFEIEEIKRIMKRKTLFIHTTTTRKRRICRLPYKKIAPTGLCILSVGSW